MQAHYPERFERDMACTEAEWLGWLPRAIGDCEWRRDGACARVRLPGGTLQLTWRKTPPRRMGLLELARLHVEFAFEGVPDEERHAFMKRFDLYTQRGGG